MIYANGQSGVFKIENDMKKSYEFTIGYMVGEVRKEASFRYGLLPDELINEFATVTNKIARFAEEEARTAKGKVDAEPYDPEKDSCVVD
jgi:hypothetical protein